MPTKKTSYEAFTKIAKEMEEKAIEAFVQSLDGQLPSTNTVIDFKALQGRKIPATTIDNWLHSARARGRLGDMSLNRAAEALWKKLFDLGVEITALDSCQIIPVPDIESKVSRAIERKFAKGK